MIDFELLAALSLFVKGLSLDDFGVGENPPLRERSFAPDHLSSATRVLEWCAHKGARILYPGHVDYPAAFLFLERPPLFLSYWGKPVWRTHRCVSVVGSREPTARSLTWMQTHLSSFLNQSAETCVVSGGARGVDQRAHAITVRGGRPTVVFLPSGLDRIYPADLVDWKEELLATGGAIVSGYDPQRAIQRSHFEGRNRLIAALSRLVLIVEARRRSGSVMTARLAREMGQTTCVLPSFPGETRAAGTLDLLFDGAIPIRDHFDLSIIASATWPGARDVSAPSAAQAPEGGD